MELTLQVQQHVDGGPVVILGGDLDYHTVGQFRACITQTLDQAPTAVHLDLRQLAFLDSSGLSALVAARKRAQHAGIQLILEHPTAIVYRTLRISGLLEYFGLPPA